MLMLIVVGGALLLVGMVMLWYCTKEREYVPKEVDELNKKNSKSDTKN